MSNTDLITIWSIGVGLFVTIIGSALVLSFRIGGLHQRIISMAKDIESIHHEIGKLKSEIAKLKVEISKIKYTLGQVLVKVDVLWKAHTSRSDKT